MERAAGTLFRDDQLVPMERAAGTLFRDDQLVSMERAAGTLGASSWYTGSEQLVHWERAAGTLFRGHRSLFSFRNRSPNDAIVAIIIYLNYFIKHGGGWMIFHFSIVQSILFFVNWISLYFFNFFPNITILFLLLLYSGLLFSVPLYFFPYSRASFLIFFVCCFILLHTCCYHVRVFMKTLLHEFPISYSHTECYLLFSRGEIVLAWLMLHLSKFNHTTAILSTNESLVSKNVY